MTTKTKKTEKWEKELRKDIKGSILAVLMEEEMDNLIGLFRKVRQEERDSYVKMLEELLP